MTDLLSLEKNSLTFFPGIYFPPKITLTSIQTRNKVNTAKGNEKSQNFLPLGSSVRSQTNGEYFFISKKKKKFETTPPYTRFFTITFGSTSSTPATYACPIHVSRH